MRNSRKFKKWWDTLTYTDQEWIKKNCRFRKVGRIAKKFNLSRSYVSELRKWVLSLPEEAQITKAPADEKVITNVNGDTAVIECTGRIRTLEELLATADVDMSEWRVKSYTANVWETVIEGNPVPLHQVKAHLERIPFWAKEITPSFDRPKRQRIVNKNIDKEVCLIIPDSQNGYRWDEKYQTLTPMHDRRAFDLAIQLIDVIRPDSIILLGDMLDLAPWSDKYLSSSTLRFTTKPTLAELHYWFALMREGAPSADISYLEGNHEARILKSIRKFLPEAEGIISIKPYGEGIWWHDVWVMHGKVVRKRGGETAGALLGSQGHRSHVYGHIHRAELARRTIWTKDGSKEAFAMCPGTIARIDPGAVPAFNEYNDWQQGLALMTWTGEHVIPELIPIVDGKAYYRGSEYVGRDRSAEIAAATGWPALDNTKKL